MDSKISKKKIFIALSIVIILLLISIIATTYFIYKKNSIPIELVSNDNTFKITIPGTIKFERKDTDTLDIFSSKDEMILSSTVIVKQKEIDLSDIVALEMAGLSRTRTNLENLSNLNKIEIKNYEAYEYSYTYFDTDYNDNFYVQIIWIETEKNIYVLDLEVITKNQEKYKPLFNDIINSFEEILY